MARGTIFVKNESKSPTKRVCIARVDPSTGIEDDAGAIEPGLGRSYNSSQLFPGEYRVTVDFQDGGRVTGCVLVADDAETVYGTATTGFQRPATATKAQVAPKAKAPQKKSPKKKTKRAH